MIFSFLYDDIYDSNEWQFTWTNCALDFDSLWVGYQYFMFKETLGQLQPTLDLFSCLDWP